MMKKLLMTILGSTVLSLGLCATAFAGNPIHLNQADFEGETHKKDEKGIENGGVSITLYGDNYILDEDITLPENVDLYIEMTSEDEEFELDINGHKLILPGEESDFFVSQAYWDSEKQIYHAAKSITLKDSGERLEGYIECHNSPVNLNNAYESVGMHFTAAGTKGNFSLNMIALRGRVEFTSLDSGNLQGTGKFRMLTSAIEKVEMDEEMQSRQYHTTMLSADAELLNCYFYGGIEASNCNLMISSGVYGSYDSKTSPIFLDNMKSVTIGDVDATNEDVQFLTAKGGNSSAVKTREFVLNGCTVGSAEHLQSFYLTMIGDFGPDNFAEKLKLNKAMIYAPYECVVDGLETYYKYAFEISVNSEYAEKYDLWNDENIQKMADYYFKNTSCKTQVLGGDRVRVMGEDTNALVINDKADPLIPTTPAKEQEITLGAAKGKISYNLQGGTAGEILQISSNGKKAKLLNPTKEGYTFKGWYWGTKKVSSITEKQLKGSSSIDLVAKFVENTYSITYKKVVPEKGAKITGDKVKSQTKILYSAQVQVTSANLTATTKAGKTYQLVGWTKVPGGTTVEYKPGETVSKLSAKKGGKVVLYPVWK